MNVEQHVVLMQKGRQPVADPVLVVDRLWPHAQVTVQVAVAFARVLAIGLGVGDGQEGDLAALDRDATGAAILDHARDGVGPAGLVAVDGTEDEKLRPRLQPVEADGLERRVDQVWRGHRLICQALRSWE